MTALFALLLACASAEPPTDGTVSWSELGLTAIDNTPIEPDALIGKAVLVVNVASKCGFTPQYEGLQTLHTSHGDRGLEIVGVPCNQFGWQEPAENGEIAEFCRMTYGVEFTMLGKQDVNGRDRSPLYSRLVNSPAGGGGSIKWNFEKFVVGRDGVVVARFGSKTKPDDPKLLAAIDRALEATAPVAD